MQCVQEARRREVGKQQEARISRALQAMVISLDSMLSVMGSQCKRYSDLSFCSWNLKSQEWIVWGSTASNRVHTIYLRLTTIFQSFSKCNSKLCTWGKVDIFLQPQQSTKGLSIRDLKKKNKKPDSIWSIINIFRIQLRVSFRNMPLTISVCRSPRCN